MMMMRIFTPLKRRLSKVHEYLELELTKKGHKKKWQSS